MIITLDGPAGTGKSTVAKHVASRLGFQYLDTGAMYRAVTLYLDGLGLLDEEGNPTGELDEQVLGECRIRFNRENDETHLFLNDVNVDIEIRSERITDRVSRVSAMKTVRKVLLQQQREIAGEQDIVVEGRDIGSVVFPDAEAKFYVDASPRERTLRRARELSIDPGTSEFVELEKKMQERDRKDRERATAPLVCPLDAFCMDTTTMNVEEVVDYIVWSVSKKK